MEKKTSTDNADDYMLKLDDFGKNQLRSNCSISTLTCEVFYAFIELKFYTYVYIRTVYSYSLRLHFISHDTNQG